VRTIEVRVYTVGVTVGPDTLYRHYDL